MRYRCRNGSHRPGKAELIKKTTEELGLTICATHVGFDELENDMDWMIELHKMWDSRYVGLGAMPSVSAK